MAVVSMKNLLESGVHFGHQMRRWNPRMKKFIFADRNGVHIIDLQQTMTCIKEAFEAARNTILASKSVLFVGTKKQARQAIEREAQNCDMHYVNSRWLGGTLTNFETIRKSLLQLKKLEKMEVDGTFDLLPKKEVSHIMKQRAKLEKNLGGIKDMKTLPGIIFIIDTNKEAIAVKEAIKMKIPIIAVVDTNCNPDNITYPIPGNDDAIRAISLFTQIISKAVIEAENEIGLGIIENLQEEGKEANTTEETSIDQSTETSVVGGIAATETAISSESTAPATPAADAPQSIIQETRLHDAQETKATDTNIEHVSTESAAQSEAEQNTDTVTHTTTETARDTHAQPVTHAPSEPHGEENKDDEHAK